MRKGKVHLQSWVKADIVKAIDIEVERGKYLNTSRSEVIEVMLELLMKKLGKNEKSSEALRAEIIRKRKEEK